MNQIHEKEENIKSPFAEKTKQSVCKVFNICNALSQKPKNYYALTDNTGKPLTDIAKKK